MDKIRNIWGKASLLASDLGLPYTTVHSWFVRERIPAVHDLDLIEAAKKRGMKLTLDDLASVRCSRSARGNHSGTRKTTRYEHSDAVRSSKRQAGDIDKTSNNRPNLACDATSVGGAA